LPNRPADITPETGPEIQPADWRDVRDVYLLEKACFEEDAWPLWDVLGVLTFPEIIRLKAELGNKLVGFIAVDQRPQAGEAWIATVGVLPSYRRQGIATRLLEAAEGQVDQPVIKLSVRAGNRPAVQLYRRRGYALAGIWPQYYTEQVDALIFQKKLLRS
jgi:ribosomal protein S18 acetylase RimI-like enzyme